MRQARSVDTGGGAFQTRSNVPLDGRRVPPARNMTGESGPKTSIASIQPPNFAIVYGGAFCLRCCHCTKPQAKNLLIHKGRGQTAGCCESNRGTRVRVQAPIHRSHPTSTWCPPSSRGLAPIGTETRFTRPKQPRTTTSSSYHSLFSSWPK